LNPGISKIPGLFLLLCLLVPRLVYSAQLEPYTEASGKDFSLPDLNDRTQALQDYRGKVVLVNFWASWCPPCIYEMPELKRLKDHFADRPFEIVAINVGEKKYKVRKFTKLINLNLPVLLDTSSETFNGWGVKTLPTSFLIDSDGKTRYRVRGNPGWETDETLIIIEGMLP
jgi:thiol-disulfide isomerase/thioredoxin